MSFLISTPTVKESRVSRRYNYRWHARLIYIVPPCSWTTVLYVFRDASAWRLLVCPHPNVHHRQIRKIIGFSFEKRGGRNPSSCDV